MSNTMRPTKPGTLSLTSRPAKRTAAKRGSRPTSADEASASSKPYQRDAAPRSAGGTDGGKPKTIERKATASKGVERRANASTTDESKRTATAGSAKRNATPGRPAGPGRPARGPAPDRARQPARPGLKTRAAKPGNGNRVEKPNRPERAQPVANTDRLAKRLAAELPCSRGDAERYIEGGWVAVDGKVQEERGLRVAPSQGVSLLPGARLEEGRPVTVLVHKPAGMYADDQPGSARDLILPENLMPGDRSGQRYLKRMFNGLKLVTPLERAASGLVVYTQEYAVARKLVEEGRLVEQEYIAQVEGKLSEADLARMQRGMPYEGRGATPMKVSWQNETHLRFALKSPMPGFIEAVCEAAGLRLLALRRLRIGRLPMAGLAVGQWRYRLEYERF